MSDRTQLLQAVSKFVLIEILFVFLPIIVFSMMWPASGYHPSSVWVSPEIPMTSCTLIGLTIARVSQSAAYGRSPSHHSQSERKSSAASYGLINAVLVILLVFAIAAIGQSVQGEAGLLGTVLNYLLLAVSIVVFLILNSFTASQEIES